MFYNLQFHDTPASSIDLMTSFGWQQEEWKIQHDIHEFFSHLTDRLEKSLNRVSNLKGTFANLFKGKIVNIIK